MKIKSLLLASFALMLCARTGQALPAFSRAYETSCATCHRSIPALNRSGEAFLAGGYRFPPDSGLEVKNPGLALGSPRTKQLWPRFSLPTRLPGRLPISALLAQKHLREYPDSEPERWGNELKAALFLSGKTGDQLSFFLELELEDESEPEVYGFLAWRLGPHSELRSGRLRPIPGNRLYRHAGTPAPRLRDRAELPGLLARQDGVSWSLGHDDGIGQAWRGSLSYLWDGDERSTQFAAWLQWSPALYPRPWEQKGDATGEALLGLGVLRSRFLSQGVDETGIVATLNLGLAPLEIELWELLGRPDGGDWRSMHRVEVAAARWNWLRLGGRVDWDGEGALHRELFFVAHPQQNFKLSAQLRRTDDGSVRHDLILSLSVLL
jgi:hypothetical protein